MTYQIHSATVLDIFLEQEPYTKFRNDFLETSKCQWLQDCCIDWEIQTHYSGLGVVLMSIQANMTEAEATEYFLRFDP